MPLRTLKNLVVPQDQQFFDLLEKQAEAAHEASHALSALMGDYSGVKEKAGKIKDLEHRGDELMRAVYTALNKTFIVPMDHGDISALASALDDVLDMADHASAELAKLLSGQTAELKKAVAALNHSRTYGRVPGYCDRIKGLEMQADEVYKHAIAELFRKTDAIEIMKQKEILDCLESATDKADKASQTISDIVMKHG